MPVPINSEEGKALRKMIPLDTYPKAAFEELCTNISVEQVQDDYLFKKGDTDTSLVYLLSGKVTLQAEGLVVEVIEAKNEPARFALAHQIPRKIDAIANGEVKLVRLNADVINNPPPIEFKEDNGYTIIEENDAESDDWLNVLLRLPLFQNLPPANLQKLLVSITTAQFAPGDIIIDTGSPVECFYIVNRGQCLRSRPGSAGSIERKAVTGETFGDEYLILDVPSREKITALTDVTLIQLARGKFIEQVTTPLLKYITADEMETMVNEGALLLDVRPKQQAEKTPFDTGIHIPYANLQNMLNDLDQNRKIITCADEKTSQAATFLLMKHNFDTYALVDGSEPSEPETIEELGINKPAQSAPTLALGTPTPIQTDNSTEEEDRENQTAKTLDPKAELRFLRTENKRLSAYTQHLEKKITQLKLEKQKLSMRSQLLALQLKKLKEIMVSYSKK